MVFQDCIIKTLGSTKELEGFIYGLEEDKKFRYKLMQPIANCARISTVVALSVEFIFDTVLHKTLHFHKLSKGVTMAMREKTERK